jgi:hypothetical protein
MRCHECGVGYDELHGLLLMNNSILGPYSIDDVDYRECPQCGERLFPSATIKAIEANERKLLEGFLRKLPISDYVKATTAAEMLGISRQAIHKHPRIRRGFVFQINHEGCWWYLKKSVEKYIETGDGRFSLYNFSVTQRTGIRTLIGESTAQGFVDSDLGRLVDMIKQPQPDGCDTEYCSRQGNQKLISFVFASNDSFDSAMGDDYAATAYSS